MLQSILTDAQGRYRTLVSTKSSFSDALKAVEAWLGACKDKAVQIKFEDDFCKLVCTIQAFYMVLLHLLFSSLLDYAV